MAPLSPQRHLCNRPLDDRAFVTAIAESFLDRLVIPDNLQDGAGYIRVLNHVLRTRQSDRDLPIFVKS